MDTNHEVIFILHDQKDSFLKSQWLTDFWATETVLLELLELLIEDFHRKK